MCISLECARDTAVRAITFLLADRLVIERSSQVNIRSTKRIQASEENHGWNVQWMSSKRFAHWIYSLVKNGHGYQLTSRLPCE